MIEFSSWSPAVSSAETAGNGASHMFVDGNSPSTSVPIDIKSNAMPEAVPEAVPDDALDLLLALSIQFIPKLYGAQQVSDAA